MGMMVSRSRRGRGRRRGMALLALGGIFLGAQVLGLSLGAWLWPLWLLLPGLATFLLVRERGRSFAPLTVPAAMMTALGALMLVQNLFGLWSSWAYAWALIFPASFGLGLTFYGDLARRPTVAQVGDWMARVGVGLFVVGAIFWEVLVNFSGIGGWVLPLLLVAAGAYFLLRKPKPKPSRRQQALAPHRAPVLADRDPLDELRLDLDDEPLPVRRR